jgi:phosphoribosyl 1,2-cyclic phosphodiesterase
LLVVFSLFPPKAKQRTEPDSAQPAAQTSLFDFWGGPDPQPSPPPGAPQLAAGPLLALRRPPEKPRLRVGVLGSGSGGNAVVVESGGKRILIDAGFSCRELIHRMAVLGVEAKSLSAVVLTHEHQDHCKGIRQLAKRFKLPVYATAGTLEGMGLKGEVARSAVVMRSGEPVEVAGCFTVEPFAIPHDAREPVGLVVEDGDGCRLGVCADIGHATRLAWGRLADLDVLVLETNHDLDMLRNGPYPWSLKQRVAGRHGHLSNREAADGLPELLSDRLRWVVLYHLSRTNNLPGLAAATLGEVLDRERCGARLAVTEQDHPSPWLEVSP